MKRVVHYDACYLIAQLQEKSLNGYEENERTLRKIMNSMQENMTWSRGCLVNERYYRLAYQKN